VVYFLPFSHSLMKFNVPFLKGLRCCLLVRNRTHLRTRSVVSVGGVGF
jgi:hypothetical protein